MMRHSNHYNYVKKILLVLVLSVSPWFWSVAEVLGPEEGGIGGTGVLKQKPEFVELPEIPERIEKPELGVDLIDRPEVLEAIEAAEPMPHPMETVPLPVEME